MFNEYAVDPDVCSSKESCLHLINSFSQSAGRLINKTPNDWHRKAINALRLSDLGPVLRKSYKSRLNKIVKEVLLSDGVGKDFDREKDWLSQLVETDRFLEFTATISLRDRPGIGSHHTLEDLMVSHSPLWEVPNEKIVLRNARDIVDALEPLLKVSKEIVIVEPHFKPYQRFWNTIRELISRREAYNFSQGVNKIIINCLSVSNNFQQWCEGELEGKIPPGFELEVRLWGNEDMHDRWLLTDVGGLRLGTGFDEGGEGRIQDVEISRISNESRIINHRKYCKEKALHCFVVGKAF
jgi:hypothetical protein